MADSRTARIAMPAVRSTALRLAVGVSAGGLMGLGAAPFDLWWAALAGTILACAACPVFGGRPALFGWVTGTAYFALTLWWITEPFQIDVQAHGWMAPFALAGMAGGLALFWASAFGLAARTPRPALALPALWALAELARGHLFTGFPWALPGYAWLDTPVAQWASVIGPFGLTLAGFALAAAVAQAGRARSVRGAVTAAAGGAALWGGGLALTPSEQDLSGRPVVRLVQPNAPQAQKWDPARAQAFYERKLALSSGEVPPALVIWPETALPMLLRDAGPALAAATRAAGGVPLATGIQRLEDGRYFNALVVTDAAGVPQRVYDKHHLVPFGEYMPFPALFERLGIEALAVRARAGFSAGPGPVTLDLGELGTALPLICYEAVFPHAIATAPRPDWLLHVTNDAWFGAWSGPYQHLAQARFRAIETGLPVMRAANTGVSAAIDGAGRVLGSLPLNEAGALDAPLPPPLPPTPYSRTGDWPAFFVALALLAGAAAVRPRERH